MTATATVACSSCGAAAATCDRFCEACGGDLRDASVASCCGEISHTQDGYCGVCGMKQPEPRDHVEATGPLAAGVSDRGRRHWRNEDAFGLSATEGGRVLAVVCDGVSTTARPDEASLRAADAALTALTRHGDEAPFGDALSEAYIAACQAVRQVPSGPNEQPPSCTFLAADVTGQRIELSSLGDCRAFWLAEEGEDQTLTVDDSWPAEQILAGARTHEEAYADPRSHVITRWLGRDADPSWDPRRVSFTVARPGRLVLCSDGLWNYAQSATEVAAVADDGDPLTIARRLVNWANEQGGQDNITVVVIEMPGPAHHPTNTAREGRNP